MEVMSKMIKWIILAVVMCILIDGIYAIGSYAKNQNEEVPDFIPMEATAYCYETKRCDGGGVRIGICAAKPEWYGQTAAVYANNGGEPGEFLGYYECLDTGGDDIQNGRVIDIYNPSEDWCRRFGRQQVLVLLIDGVG